jgi:hypothetical protein
VTVTGEPLGGTKNLLWLQPLRSVNKQDAIALIRVETGYGRRVIDQMLDKLNDEGRITIHKDFDGRSLRISRDDIALVIRVLKREIE